jgi:tRNA (pseudouridine54-N1)-methyltransferase
MRRFIIVGTTAKGSGEFSLDDLPSSSGRLDVLLRCVRAALLTSHGLRANVVVYLMLLGEGAAPRVVRIGGEGLKFVRPDERSLAVLVQKLLLRHVGQAVGQEGAFVEQKPGLAVADGGLECVLAELGGASVYVLEEGAGDVRDLDLASEDVALFVGDHRGFDDATRGAFEALGAVRVSVGPVSLHSDDVVTLVTNELDRRNW